MPYIRLNFWQSINNRLDDGETLLTQETMCALTRIPVGLIVGFGTFSMDTVADFSPSDGIPPDFMPESLSQGQGCYIRRCHVYRSQPNFSDGVHNPQVWDLYLLIGTNLGMGCSRDMQDNQIFLIQGHELDMYQELISPSSTRSSRGMMFEVQLSLARERSHWLGRRNIYTIRNP